VLASPQGRSAAQIAVVFAATEGYVRDVIHAFNDTAFAALDPRWSGGRPVSSRRPPATRSARPPAAPTTTPAIPAHGRAAIPHGQEKVINLFCHDGKHLTLAATTRLMPAVAMSCDGTVGVPSRAWVRAYNRWLWDRHHMSELRS